MERVAIMPRDGNCITGDRALFEQADTAQQAIESCFRCPALEQCAGRVGALALQLPPQANEGVIAGKYRRWGVQTPERQCDWPYELPKDPQEALDVLRFVAVGSRQGGSKFNKKIQPAFDRLVSAHAAQDPLHLAEALGPTYQKGWVVLGRTIFDQAIYRRGRATAFDDHATLCAVADLYFKDVIRLDAMKFPRMHIPGLALRYPASYFEELYQRYADNKYLPPGRIRRLIILTNINYPEIALQEFQLRLELFREQYPDRKTMPDVFIREMCARYSTAACADKLEQLRDTYAEMLAQPKYRQYDAWLLQQAALLTPRIRDHTLRNINQFFRKKYKTFSLDRTDTNDNDMYERVGAQGVDVADQVMQRIEVEDALAALSPAEKLAVAAVFGLDGMLEDREVPTEAELCKLLHTTDIKGYVQTVILPKLQSQHRQ